MDDHDQILADIKRYAAARMRYTKTQLSKESRALGEELLRFANQVDSESAPSINPSGLCGDSAKKIDQLAARYDAELTALSDLEDLTELRVAPSILGRGAVAA